METFADRLKDARAAAGIGQRELARAVGISHVQVSRYESGSSIPRPAVAKKLAATLGVSTLWLTSGAPHARRVLELNGNLFLEVLRAELPPEVLTRLEDSAKAQRRTIEQQAMFILEKAMDEYLSEDLQDARNELRAARKRTPTKKPA